jgi:hypothetical protein
VTPKAGPDGTTDQQRASRAQNYGGATDALGSVWKAARQPANSELGLNRGQSLHRQLPRGDLLLWPSLRIRAATRAAKIFRHGSRPTMWPIQREWSGK